MSNALYNIRKQIKAARDDIQIRQDILNRLIEKEQQYIRLTELCPSCGGTGEETYTDAAGSTDWRECSVCNGVGKVGPLKCACGRIITITLRAVYCKRECPWCGASL